MNWFHEYIIQRVHSVTGYGRFGHRKYNENANIFRRFIARLCGIYYGKFLHKSK